MSPSHTHTQKQKLNQFLSGDGHWFYIKEMIDLGIDIWKVDIFFKISTLATKLYLPQNCLRKIIIIPA